MRIISSSQQLTQAFRVFEFAPHGTQVVRVIASALAVIINPLLELVRSGTSSTRVSRVKRFGIVRRTHDFEQQAKQFLRGMSVRARVLG